MTRTIPSTLKRLLEWDQKLSESLFRRGKEKWGKRPNYFDNLKYLEWSCHGILWLIFNFAMLYYSSNYTLWMNLLLALIVDIVIVAVSKSITRRRRPSYNMASSDISISVDKLSFPSGHATRATVIFGFFTFLYPIFLPFSVLLLAWAAAILVSRILLGRHHVLDVLGGLLIGALEWILLALLWMDSSTAANVASSFFGEDPWSSA
eukprot:TRINITY_DN3984_c0_g1_i2.p1 TRINITY_DN3984_c0_g1~~TRINITY_DN3984_c0_g1_i2.p1  ORF type:complete len:206 (-),score=49.45 TRINITY_DN3984_c0_g1_i2:254-871(-)